MEAGNVTQGTLCILLVFENVIINRGGEGKEIRHVITRGSGELKIAKKVRCLTYGRLHTMHGYNYRNDYHKVNAFLKKKNKKNNEYSLGPFTCVSLAFCHSVVTPLTCTALFCWIASVTKWDVNTHYYFYKLLGEPNWWYFKWIYEII